MNQIRKITLVSASPKVGEASLSDWLSDRAKTVFSPDGLTVRQLNVRASMTKPKEQVDFGEMLSSDTLVFIFPLYIFCLPGILIRYLQDYYAYYAARAENSRTSSVYCVVNCGFPEAGINEEAVRVIKSFSGKIGAEFRFGLMIGGGGMLLGAADAPFMKKTLSAIDGAFRQMIADHAPGASGDARNIEVNVNFPRRLYFFMASQGWYANARKNKLRKKDLFTTPYA